MVIRSQLVPYRAVSTRSQTTLVSATSAASRRSPDQTLLYTVGVVSDSRCSSSSSPQRMAFPYLEAVLGEHLLLPLLISRGFWGCPIGVAWFRSWFVPEISWLGNARRLSEFSPSISAASFFISMSIFFFSHKIIDRCLFWCLQYKKDIWGGSKVLFR